MSFSFCSNTNITVAEPSSIHKKAEEALKYCKQKKMNTTFCILIDMSIPSGKNRIMVYNFTSKSVEKSGLCSHGCGTNPWGATLSKENPVFSNVAESHCSSLGKYKIGARGYSNWGINVNYQLHGLESTNSNSVSRQIVLHSWDAVSEIEVYPNGTPEGWGCPAVSDNMMRYIDSKLKASGGNILMWVYR